MREFGITLLFAFATGLLSVIQGAINATVGRTQGQYFMIIGVSLFQILTALLMLRLSGPISVTKPAAFIPWLLVSGVLGVCIMYGVSKAAGTIGALPAFVMAIAGQIAASAIVDQWGLTGLPRSPMTWQKLGSLLTIGAGILWLLKSDS